MGRVKNGEGGFVPRRKRRRATLRLAIEMFLLAAIVTAAAAWLALAQVAQTFELQIREELAGRARGLATAESGLKDEVEQSLRRIDAYLRTDPALLERLFLETPDLWDVAEPLMHLHGLDLLEILNAEGVVLSSGHRPEQINLDARERLRLPADRAVLHAEETDDGSAAAFVERHVLEYGSRRRQLMLVGGRWLGQQLVDRAAEGGALLLFRSDPQAPPVLSAAVTPHLAEAAKDWIIELGTSAPGPTSRSGPASESRPGDRGAGGSDGEAVAEPRAGERSATPGDLEHAPDARPPVPGERAPVAVRPREAPDDPGRLPPGVASAQRPGAEVAAPHPVTAAGVGENAGGPGPAGEPVTSAGTTPPPDNAAAGDAAGADGGAPAGAASERPGPGEEGLDAEAEGAVQAVTPPGGATTLTGSDGSHWRTERIELVDWAGRPCGSIVVAVGRDRFDALLGRMRNSFLVLGSGVGLLAALVGVLIARGTTRPVDDLIRAFDAIAAGEADYTFEVRAGDELQELRAAFSRMHRALERQRRRSLAAERVAAWREVARHVAHEVKNPLAPIRTTVENLIRARRQAPERFDRMFAEGMETILEEVQQLSRIVGEFAEFARLPLPSPSRVDLDGLIDRAVELYAAEPGIDIKRTVDPRMPPVELDADQISRALKNVIGNAIEAVRDQPEDRRRDPRVEIRANSDEGQAQIEVCDNGPGFSEESSRRLFEPYFTTKASGTGLGLALAYRIVVEHGGVIFAENRASGGARVVIRLPLKAVSPGEVASQRESYG